MDQPYNHLDTMTPLNINTALAQIRAALPNPHAALWSASQHLPADEVLLAYIQEHLGDVAHEALQTADRFVTSQELDAHLTSSPLLAVALGGGIANLPDAEVVAILALYIFNEPVISPETRRHLTKACIGQTPEDSLSYYGAVTHKATLTKRYWPRSNEWLEGGPPQMVLPNEDWRCALIPSAIDAALEKSPRLRELGGRLVQVALDDPCVLDPKPKARYVDLRDFENRSVLNDEIAQADAGFTQDNHVLDGALCFLSRYPKLLNDSMVATLCRLSALGLEHVHYALFHRLTSVVEHAPRKLQAALLASTMAGIREQEKPPSTQPSVWVRFTRRLLGRSPKPAPVTPNEGDGLWSYTLVRDVDWNYTTDAAALTFVLDNLESLSAHGEDAPLKALSSCIATMAPEGGQDLLGRIREGLEGSGWSPPQLEALHVPILDYLVGSDNTWLRGLVAIVWSKHVAFGSGDKPSNPYPHLEPMYQRLLDDPEGRTIQSIFEEGYDIIFF